MVHLWGAIQITMRARLVSCFFCILALASVASAEDRRGGSPSLDRVLPHIRNSVPGKFYDAEGPFFAPDGQASYRIKWMTPDGRLIWFSVDARSGQIMGGAPASNSYSAPPPDRYRPREDRSPPRGNFRDDDNGWNRGWNGNDNRGDSRRDDRGWNDRSSGRDEGRYDRDQRDDRRDNRRGPNR